MRLGGSALVLAAALSMTGCVGFWPLSAPTTSYTNDAGEDVTDNWREFPGVAGIEPEEVLAGPVMEDIDSREADLINAAKSAVTTALTPINAMVSIPWSAEGSGEWHADGDNGYGAATMLQTYNSAIYQAEVTLPRGEWDTVLDAIESVAIDFGMVTRSEHELDGAAAKVMRSVSFTHGSEFLDVSIEDNALDPGALSAARDDERMIAGITLFYGMTTLSRADRAEFEKRVQPYLGLEMPETIS